MTAGTNGNSNTAWLAQPVSARLLLGLFAGWMALGQLLLWRFLDIATVPVYLAGGMAAAGIAWGVAGLAINLPGPSRGTLVLCFVVALLFLMLSGEGRFFYANADWQVRFAVLRDMAINPWPFIYTARPNPDLLRAPIGMFLVPALAFKALGLRAGDLALLIQNSLLLGILLALASTLLPNARSRGVALLIFFVFSGMDALGDLLIHGLLSDHLDDWAVIQYSSTVTLAFWVPQHALAGWIGAIGYMLWRDGHLRLGGFLTLLPLTALWSPFGLIGSMPFATIAGIRAMISRQLGPVDIVLPALACLLCAPTFLYLSAANGEVGMRLLPIPFLQWLIFQSLETLPYLLPLLFAAKEVRFGRDSLAIVALCLLAMPFVQIGWSIDFMMRASIPALAILSMMVTQHMLNGDRGRLVLIVVLAIGSLTGLSEIRRGIVNDPAPEVRCSFFKAWDQTFAYFPKGSYLAPLAEVPPLVRPQSPTPASAIEPARCWDGVWKEPLQPKGHRSGG